MRLDNDLLDDVLTRDPLDIAESIIVRHHQDYLNAKRLRQWRLKWRLKFGVWPNSADIYLWPYQGRMKPATHPVDTNANVVKMPHHKRQYGGGAVPSIPDDAA